MHLRKDHKSIHRYHRLAIALYGLLAWTLISNQGLPFPLGEIEQRTVIAAVGGPAGGIEPSWVSSWMDPFAARLWVEDPYARLQGLRRLFAVMALVGLVVWVERSSGNLEAVWIAVLGLVFLPLRWTAGTLAPQSFFLFFYIWGCLLAWTRPWSKTGTPEQFAGGAFLGCAGFASPWGWLFVLAIPFQCLLSENFRRKFERPFWLGLIGFTLPLAVWVGLDVNRFHDLLGWNAEWASPQKTAQVGGLALEQIGPFFLAVLILGGREAWKSRSQGSIPLAPLLWPILPVLVFGFATPNRLAMALPGLLFLGVYGFRWVGRLFVHPAERRILATLSVMVYGYTAFFGSLPVIRERQAHSQEVEALADLMLEEIPAGRAVALSRLNPLIDYLNTLHPEKEWIPVPDTDFDWVVLEARILENRWYTPGIWELWIDPKRAREPGYEVSSRMLSDLLLHYPYQVHEGNRSVNVVRVDLSGVPGRLR